MRATAKNCKKTPKSSIVQSSRSFNVIQGHRHFFTVSMINNDRHGRKNWTWNGVQRMLFEAHTWLHNYVINSVEISHNERQLAKSPEIRKTFFGLNNNCKTRAKFRPNFCQYCPVRRRRTGTTFWRGGGAKRRILVAMAVRCAVDFVKLKMYRIAALLSTHQMRLSTSDAPEFIFGRSSIRLDPSCLYSL